MKKERLSVIIKNYRERHSLTQQEFADKCGISKSYVSVLERERDPNTLQKPTPQLDTYENLAKGMGLTSEELLSRVEDLQLIESNFRKLINKRYSVRSFTDRIVEKEKINAILDIGNLAPTGKNFQPQRIYVLQSEDALKKLDSLSPCRFGANTVLLFTYNTDEDWKNPLEEGVRSGIEDVSIVATYVMLAAAELGLGTCWCNYFANSELEKVFNLPQNERSVLFMPVGYPSKDAKPTTMHSEKKELALTVQYL